MDDRNNIGGRAPQRTAGSLRASRKKTPRRKRASGAEKSSFIVRFNIALTLTAAVLLMSKINTELTSSITAKAVSVISQGASLSDIKAKAEEIYAGLLGDDGERSVFSEDNDADIEKSITEQIDREREMEENLKNQ